MIRTFLAMMGLLVCACAAGPQAESDPEGERQEQNVQASSSVEFSVISSGQYGRAASHDPPPGTEGPRVEIALDAASYRQLWRDHVGDGDPPHVELAERSVVFLLLGSRPTGGYAIRVDEVEREGRTLRIEANLREPAPTDIVTQAFTAPFAVISVGTRDFGEAEWTSGERVVARWRDASSS